MTDDPTGHHRPTPPRGQPGEEAEPRQDADPARGASAPYPPAPGWGPTINTGLPASLPPGVWPGEGPAGRSASGLWADPFGAGTPGPEYHPYDPALGPPWPALVAPTGYVPPRLIRWPIYAGLVILIAQFAGWLPSLH
jgi:hypothetical protein